jgi:hypothetical protein
MKFLLCLPNMQGLKSMLALTQIIQSTPVDMNFFALRLIPLSERDSSVMMATESEETIKFDAALNIFKTFGTMNRIGMKLLMSVCPYDDFAEQILNSADEMNANVIIIPWNPHRNTDDQMEKHYKDAIGMMYTESHRKSLIDAVCSKAACSVVVFVDRGFTIQTPEYDHQMTTKSSRSAILAAMETSPQRVIIPFIGGEDSREAVILALYFTHYKGIKTKILRLVKKEDTNGEKTVGSASGSNPGSRNGSNTSTPKTSPKMSRFVSNTTLGELDAAAAEKSNNEDSRLLENIRVNQEDVQVEELGYSNLENSIREYVGSNNLQKNDLLIIGKQLYENTLRAFVDEDCLASVCIVQKSGSAPITP